MTYSKLLVKNCASETDLNGILRKNMIQPWIQPWKIKVTCTHMTFMIIEVEIKMLRLDQIVGLCQIVRLMKRIP